MGILNVLQAIIGILIVFVLPGLLAVKLFYNKVDLLEKILLTVGISISAVIIIGLILGYIGIFSIWSSLISYCVLFLIFGGIKLWKSR